MDIDVNMEKWRDVCGEVEERVDRLKKVEEDYRDVEGCTKEKNRTATSSTNKLFLIEWTGSTSMWKSGRVEDKKEKSVKSQKTA